MTFNKETETMYRGLTPHKITPMSGVLHTEHSFGRVEVVRCLFVPGEPRRYHATSKYLIDYKRNHIDLTPLLIEPDFHHLDLARQLQFADPVY